MVAFTDLPREIITSILASGLDYPSFVRCTQVCKMLRSIIQNSELLLYLIELDISGYVDNPTSGIPLHRRVDSWLRLQTSGNELKQPATPDMYTIEQDSSSHLQACQGYICYSRNGRSDRDHDVVSVLRLPSSIYNTHEEEWDLPLFPFKIRVLTIDPSQDLLLLMESKVTTHSRYTQLLHVVSLSNGQHHPLASGETVEIPGVFETADYRGYALTIRGRFVSASIRLQGCAWFAIVDWQTGQTYPLVQDSGILSAALIDSNLAVVIKPARAILQLQVYAISDQSSGGSGGTFTHVRSLELCEEFQYSRAPRCSNNISCYIKGDSYHRSTDYYPPSRVPFFKPTSPSDIISITIWGRGCTSDLPWAVIFVSAKALLPSNAKITKSAESIPWQIWSTNNATQYSPSQNAVSMVPLVSGERAVIWEWLWPHIVQLRLFDMNGVRVMRRGGILEQFVDQDGMLGASTAQCSPPLVVDYQGFTPLMMDDERIVFRTQPPTQNPHQPQEPELESFRIHIQAWNVAP